MEFMRRETRENEDMVPMEWVGLIATIAAIIGTIVLLMMI